jgi:hypothetical protein
MKGIVHCTPYIQAGACRIELVFQRDVMGEARNVMRSNVGGCDGVRQHYTLLHRLVAPFVALAPQLHPLISPLSTLHSLSFSCEHSGSSTACVIQCIVHSNAVQVVPGQTISLTRCGQMHACIQSHPRSSQHLNKPDHKISLLDRLEGPSRRPLTHPPCFVALTPCSSTISTLGMCFLFSFPHPHAWEVL